MTDYTRPSANSADATFADKAAYTVITSPVITSWQPSNFLLEISVKNFTFLGATLRVLDTGNFTFAAAAPPSVRRRIILII